MLQFKKPLETANERKYSPIKRPEVASPGYFVNRRALSAKNLFIRAYSRVLAVPFLLLQYVSD